MHYPQRDENEPLNNQGYNPNLPPAGQQNYQYQVPQNPYNPPPVSSAPADPKPLRDFNNYDDLEGDKEFMKEVRRGFVIKVYSILSVTLLFTALICVAPVASTAVADYMERNVWILITFAILAFIPLYALFCFTNMARKVPINYILLFSFVFCESILVAYACASVGSPKIVLIAALMTMGLTIVLTVFACTTKIDFTMCWGVAFVLGGCLLMFGIFAIILRSDILYLLYCTIGIFVYGLYLLIDTQLVCGGHTWKLTEDDYIIGALILYMDIIVLFLKILALLSRKN